MGKRCVVCDGEAEFLIKGTSDLYCKGCGEDSFADISYLEKIKEQQIDVDLPEEVDQLIEEKLTE